MFWLRDDVISFIFHFLIVFDVFDVCQQLSLSLSRIS